MLKLADAITIPSLAVRTWKRPLARGRWMLPGILLVALHCQWAAASPTQDEVFRSINQNVDSTVDFSKAIPFLVAGIALCILVGLFNHWRRRPIAVKRTLNNPSKLLRDVARGLRLKKIAVKQLKMMAEEQKIEHPLTLLLCPSALGKGVRSKNPKLDRETLNGLVQRMRAGLSEQRSSAPHAVNNNKKNTADSI